MIFVKSGVVVKAMVTSLLGVALVACSTGSNGKSALISPDAVDAFTSLAIVDGIEFEFGDEFPVTVEALVNGAFTGGCTRINDVTEQHIGDTIVITLLTNTTDKEGCESEAARFLQFVPLDIEGLKAGVYTVIVNGFSARFQLLLDNVAPTVG